MLGRLTHRDLRELVFQVADYSLVEFSDDESRLIIARNMPLE